MESLASGQVRGGRVPSCNERKEAVEQIFGLDIPQTLEEVCDPRHVALLVYDMQIGILSQIPNAGPTTTLIAEVLASARAAGVRVFFTRHLSLPMERISMERISDGKNI